MLNVLKMFIETNPLIKLFREDKFINAVLDKSTQAVKDELKKLTVKGAVIQKPFDDNTTLDDLDKKPEAIWSILVLYGVLTCKPRQKDIYDVFIPNKSLQFFLLEKIHAWEKLRPQPPTVTPAIQTAAAPSPSPVK